MENKMVNNIAVIGSSGAIGSAFTQQLALLYPEATIHAFSRSEPKEITENTSHYRIDYADEASIESAALLASKYFPLTMVIIATGILNDDGVAPEKSLKEMSAVKFRRLFEINTILPALIAKHFLPKLSKDKRVVFAAISARVGSISDNHLGGWYAYRSSKAALNMIIKNAAIEIGRRNKQAVIVGLHPGTVASALSEPFQRNVPEAKLFTPEFSVKRLLIVLENLTAKDSGKCFAWDGSEVEP